MASELNKVEMSTVREIEQREGLQNHLREGERVRGVEHLSARVMLVVAQFEPRMFFSTEAKKSF